jgi:phenylalanyl-tRNA synthetase beta chain
VNETHLGDTATWLAETALTQGYVLPATEQQPLPRELRDDVGALSEHLLRLGKLTHFQATKLLRGISKGLFDGYQGGSIPAGQKSLAYALGYQADDRTLTDKEVDKAHKAIEGRPRNVLKGEIRGRND